MKIGVMFGNPETTTGGNALKFYASVRLDIRRTGSIKKGEEVIGSETRVKVVKNKVAPPFKTAEFEILYGDGISREGEIVDLGVKQNIIEKSGAWYSFNGDRIGQGKENARDFLLEHKDIAAAIEKRVRAELLPAKKGPVEVPGAETAGALTRRRVRRSKPEAAQTRSTRQPARASALELLARREHSRRELTRKLAARGFPDDVIAPVARRARALGRACRSAVHGQLRPLARREGPRPAADSRRARAARHRRRRSRRRCCAAPTSTGSRRSAPCARKRFGPELPRDYAERARQARFLQYRGFDGAQIRAALELDGDSD